GRDQSRIVGLIAWRLCRVAAGERDLPLLGQSQQAIEEALRPTATGAGGECEFARNGEGQESSQWPCSHRRQITQTTCEAAMAYRFWRVHLAQEMDRFEREIGGDGHIL